MPRKPTIKKPVTDRVIRFPSPLYKKIRERAEDEQRSIQGQVIADLNTLYPKGAR